MTIWAAMAFRAATMTILGSLQVTLCTHEFTLQHPMKVGCPRAERPTNGRFELAMKINNDESWNFLVECVLHGRVNGESCENSRWIKELVTGVKQGGDHFLKPFNVMIPPGGVQSWTCHVYTTGANGNVWITQYTSSMAAQKQKAIYEWSGTRYFVKVNGEFHDTPVATEHPEALVVFDPVNECDVKEKLRVSYWDLQMKAELNVEANVTFDCEMVSYKGCHNKRQANVFFYGQGVAYSTTSNWVRAALIEIDIPREDSATWFCDVGAVSWDGKRTEELGRVHWYQGQSGADSSIEGNSEVLGGQWKLWAAFYHNPGVPQEKLAKTIIS